jgi:hypothetical protein
VSKASGKLATLRELISFGMQIGDVICFSVEDGTRGGNPTREGQRIGGGDRSMVSDYTENIVAGHLKDHRVMGIAKASRTGRDFCENGLQVRRRA